MFGRTNSDPSLKQERKRGEDSNKKWIHTNKNAGTKTIREERTTIKLRLCKRSGVHWGTAILATWSTMPKSIEPHISHLIKTCMLLIK